MVERGSFRNHPEIRVLGAGGDAKEPTLGLDHNLRWLWKIEAQRMAESSHELTRAIGEKILEKDKVKEQVEQMVAGAHDTSVQQDLKMLGVLVVRETEAKFAHEDPETGFSIQPGDIYLDLHLPPVPAHLRSRQAVEESFRLIAEYIRIHDLDHKYLIGITDEKLAELAHRQFGFEVIFPDPKDLPSDVVAGVENVYMKYRNSPQGVEIPIPVGVFMGTKDLLSRYGIEQPAHQRAARAIGQRAVGNSVTFGPLPHPD